MKILKPVQIFWLKMEFCFSFSFFPFSLIKLEQRKWYLRWSKCVLYIIVSACVNPMHSELHHPQHLKCTACLKRSFHVNYLGGQSSLKVLSIHWLDCFFFFPECIWGAKKLPFIVMIICHDYTSYFLFYGTGRMVVLKKLLPEVEIACCNACNPNSLHDSALCHGKCNCFKHSQSLGPSDF